VRIVGVQQMRHTGLAAHESAARVDLLHQVETLHRRVQRAAQPDGAGVVDQDVNSTEARRGGRHGLRHLVFVANVAA